MHKEMRLMINAYLDGELHGKSLREMENHLASCSTCQNEIMELRSVSKLLQASPIPESIPVERFITQLALSLPRRTAVSLRSKTISPGWWLIPAGLLGAWFFVQTVFTLTNVVSVASMAGLLGHAANWLGGGEESIWFSTATGLFGGQAFGELPTLSLLNNVSVFVVNLFSGFLWQAVIVLLYWAWLFLWWFRRSSRSQMVRKAA